MNPVGMQLRLSFDLAITSHIPRLRYILIFFSQYFSIASAPMSHRSRFCFAPEKTNSNPKETSSLFRSPTEHKARAQVASADASSAERAPATMVSQFREEPSDAASPVAAGGPSPPDNQPAIFPPHFLTARSVFPRSQIKHWFWYFFPPPALPIVPRVVT